jgi:hypothetical protein
MERLIEETSLPDVSSVSADGCVSDGNLKVINAALFRMGTKSMAEAYKILGYKTHHALDDTFAIPWHLIEEAAEAKWPLVPGARARKPYNRHNWDAIWGQYEAVTDLASPFALDLAAAYPKTKVVIVQRDFETWWPSFRSENLNWRFFMGSNLLNSVLCIFGIRAGNALGFLYLGLFQARNAGEVHEHARSVYDQYFADLRSRVPQERRLEYVLGSGWEPLCAFLGKEVPRVPFPHVNEREEHRIKASSNFWMTMRALGLKMSPWVVLVAGLIVAAWFALNPI